MAEGRGARREARGARQQHPIVLSSPLLHFKDAVEGRRVGQVLGQLENAGIAGRSNSHGGLGGSGSRAMVGLRQRRRRWLGRVGGLARPHQTNKIWQMRRPERRDTRKSCPAGC